MTLVLAVVAKNSKSAVGQIFKVLKTSKLQNAAVSCVFCLWAVAETYEIKHGLTPSSLRS